MLFRDPKDDELPDDEQSGLLVPAPEARPDAQENTTPFAITPEHVADVYASKLECGKVTDEQVAAVCWLAQLTQRDKLSLASLARLTRIDGGTLSKLFSGTYTATLQSMARRITNFKELHETRQAIGSKSFVETSLSRKIWQVCETARSYSVPVFIFGDSQIGKTYALQEYQRLNNHGATVYSRMPARGNLSEFVRELSRSSGLPYRGVRSATRDELMQAYNPNRVLIIDELHQCILKAAKESAGMRIGTLEFIREIWDRTGCGMVLCATNIFREEMQHGRFSGILEQLSRRGMISLQLPGILPRADMDAIAANYGLPPANDEVHQIRLAVVKAHGLTTYVNHLRGASYAASKRSQPVTWRHFISAHDVLQKLSEGAK